MRSGSSSRRLRLAVLALALAALALPAAAGASHHPRRAPQHRAGDIVVHGRWTITVRTPGGAVVSRRSFENEYVSKGLLPFVLGRRYSVGVWGVALRGTACDGGLGGVCGIVESNTLGLGTAAGQSANLTVSASATSLILRGSVDAPTAGDIDMVVSVNNLCPASVAPSAPACAGGSATDFTTKKIPPITVTAAGQQIEVTVTFTFS